MQVGIPRALLVVAVAVLMVVDLVRTQSESPHPQADARAVEAGAVRPDSSEAFLRQPAGTAVPAAAHDAVPARHPASIGAPPGGTRRPRAEPATVPRGSLRKLQTWHVRSRLLALAVIPAAAVAVIAFCVIRFAGVVHGASIHSPDGPVRDKAILSATLVGVVVLIVAALASWSVLVVARSVLRPLGRLRAGAMQMAGAGLHEAVSRARQQDGDGSPPDVEPVNLDSSDEIGDIARAFSQMRSELLRLATGEAALHGRLNAMFVNLSHRSQSLAERQIRLIENLEQGEQEAGRLTSLSTLDRIASRIHRNSQNLLILADQEAPSSWNQPIALVNAIRAAVSEIEEDRRVSIDPQPDIAVVGHAVNDVVHVLAELIENATSFSSADMLVEVSGRLLTTGGLLIDVTDRGVGMAPKDMAYANWRLENPPAADVDVPRWMGLIVVSKLAARHGIRVRLQPAEFGGLTAFVWLPDELIMQQGTASPRPGGFAGAASGRGPHEARLASGHAGRRTPAAPAAATATTATPARFAPSSGDAQDAPLGRPSRPEPNRPAAPDVPAPGDGAAEDVGGLSADGVIVPPAEGPSGSRGLPLFDAVESGWFSRPSSPASPDLTAAAGGRSPSSADQARQAAETVASPSSLGSTAAGLPRRQPKANLVPGAIPRTAIRDGEPVMPNRSAAAARDRLAGLQRGVGKGRAAAREAADPGGEAESPNGDA